MTRYVAKSLGTTKMEASRILSLKSWQTAWHSGTASLLLRSDTAGRVSHVSPNARTTAVATVADRTNEVTHL